MQNSQIPPIIILGMHRSGTSMVARLLEDLGLFLGNSKDLNHEAHFFLKLNNWMLRQCGAAWDQPRPVTYLLANVEVRALVVDYVRYLFRTGYVVSYLGLKKYIHYKSPENLKTPWGWKDPRNVFTLPIWLDLFPNAKVVHISRHGVDVAYSLMVRQQQVLKTSRVLHNRRKRLHLYWLGLKRGGFVDTLRCVSLEEAFALWEEYLEEANNHIKSLKYRAIEVKYEELLTNPIDSLISLAKFCGLPADRMTIINITRKIDRSRAYAYRNSDELRAFAEAVGRRLEAKGYSRAL